MFMLFMVFTNSHNKNQNYGRQKQSGMTISLSHPLSIKALVSNII